MYRVTRAVTKILYASLIHITFKKIENEVFCFEIGFCFLRAINMYDGGVAVFDPPKTTNRLCLTEETTDKIKPMARNIVIERLGSIRVYTYIGLHKKRLVEKRKTHRLR